MHMFTLLNVSPDSATQHAYTKAIKLGFILGRKIRNYIYTYMYLALSISTLTKIATFTQASTSRHKTPVIYAHNRTCYI